MLAYAHPGGEAHIIAVLPDPAQLVDVRQRRFVVTEVHKSVLPPDELSARPEGQQHLVTLSSVEDDGLGEELRVWELGPAARVLEKAALPDPAGFNEPRRLDAFMDMVRWGALSWVDVWALQSPSCSGVDIEDYQLDPVVRALGMPRVNLLVADAYGWSDLDLGHGFHETEQDVLQTRSEEARREILNRLLLLDHKRYAGEVKQDLPDKKAKKGKAKKRTKPKANGGTSLFSDLRDGA